jgi:hypothetical protein
MLGYSSTADDWLKTGVEAKLAEGVGVTGGWAVRPVVGETRDIGPGTGTTGG